jgi:hypothetical protein
MSLNGLIFHVGSDGGNSAYSTGYWNNCEVR